MAEMPDKAYDLAIVDPPYGINITKGFIGEQKAERNYKLGTWDTVIPSVSYFDELQRVASHRVIWGGNYYPLPPTRCFLVWDKQNDGSNIGDCEQAWTSFDAVPRMFRLNRFAEWHYPDKVGNRIHPTQKPVKLYEWLLKNYAKPGDRILDTHGGSCSIAIACYNLDFDLDCFEIDAEYHEKAVKRLEEHKAQGRLFGCSPAKI